MALNLNRSTPLSENPPAFSISSRSSTNTAFGKPSGLISLSVSSVSLDKLCMSKKEWEQKREPFRFEFLGSRCNVGALIFRKILYTKISDDPLPVTYTYANPSFRAVFMNRDVVTILFRICKEYF